MPASRPAPAPAQSPSPAQEAQDHSSPWLTTRQLAEYLGVSYSNVAHWVAAGVVPCHRVPPGFRLVRFYRAEIDEWMGRR